MAGHSESAALVIVCGLPGSGKTTHARLLEPTLNAVRFSPDEWMEQLGIDLHDEAARNRLESLQWTFARQLLSRGVSAIIEWGTWGRWERDRLRLDARTLGASVELHYLSAPEEVLFERISRRGAETPPISREASPNGPPSLKSRHQRSWRSSIARSTSSADPRGTRFRTREDTHRNPAPLHCTP